MEDTVFYSCMFIVLGIASAIFNFLQVTNGSQGSDRVLKESDHFANRTYNLTSRVQTFMFSYSGEMLTRRLRKMTLASMLKQVRAWVHGLECQVTKPVAG